MAFEQLVAEAAIKKEKEKDKEEKKEKDKEERKKKKHSHGSSVAEATEGSATTAANA